MLEWNHMCFLWFDTKNEKLGGLDKDPKLITSKMINFAERVAKNPAINYHFNTSLATKEMSYISVIQFHTEQVILLTSSSAI